MLIQLTGPLRPTESSTQIYQRERGVLDFDSLEHDINIDFEINSLHQKGGKSDVYQRQDKSYFQKPPKLPSKLDTCKLMQRFLSKQADIDKLLKIMHRRVLKEAHLPIIVKEIQAGCLISPYFKDVYLYLAQNKLPHTKETI